MPAIPPGQDEPLKVSSVDEDWAREIIRKCKELHADLNPISSVRIQVWFQGEVGDNAAWKRGIDFALKQERVVPKKGELTLSLAGVDAASEQL
jgi:hypothetical protein